MIASSWSSHIRRRPGLASERRDDVPAVSEGYGRAPDVIVARVHMLMDTLRRGDHSMRDVQEPGSQLRAASRDLA